jgi:hypothetical protein
MARENKWREKLRGNKGMRETEREQGKGKGKGMRETEQGKENES